jgi:hypothetical protein
MTALRALVAWFLALFTTSCVGSFQNVPGDTNLAHTSACMTLDAKHRTGGTIVGSSVAAGVALAGMAALEAKSHPTAAEYLSLGGIATGVLGGGASYYTQDVFQSYQDLCVEHAVAPEAPKR